MLIASEKCSSAGRAARVTAIVPFRRFRPAPFRKLRSPLCEPCPRLAIDVMKTSLKALAEVGHRALTLIVAETIFLALLVLGVIFFSA